MIYQANPVRVEAHDIVSVGPIERSGGMRLALRNGTSVVADKAMISRFIPGEGDYWVKQEDGYVYY